MAIQTKVVIDETTQISTVYLDQDGELFQQIHYEAGLVMIHARPEIQYPFDKSVVDAIQYLRQWADEMEARMGPDKAMPIGEFQKDITYKIATDELTYKFEFDGKKLQSYWDRASGIVTSKKINNAINIPNRIYQEFLRGWSDFIFFMRAYGSL